jgi:hypothetical protein
MVEESHGPSGDSGGSDHGLGEQQKLAEELD